MNNISIKPATPPQGHRFHFLDALRGIAALLVVPIHAPHGFYNVLLFPHAFLAVDFFFCLSGFVIAFSYESRLTTGLAFREFTLTRIIRLYPIAVLGTLLGAITVLFDPTAFANHLLFAQRLPIAILLGVLVLPVPHGRLFPLDYPMWTLFFEMTANLTYAGLVYWRMAGSIALGFVAALSLLALSVQRYVLGSLDHGAMLSGSAMALSRVGFSFFCGVLLYRFYRRARSSPLHGNKALLAAAVITALFLAVLCSRHPVMTTPLVEMFMVSVAFPCIVYLGAHVDVPGRWATFAAFLGTVSYPLYLLHQPLLLPLVRLTPGPFAANAVMPLTLPVLVALAWFTARYYDEPVRKAIASKLRKQTAVTSPASR